ncbi:MULTISPECIES: hypothetical protein [unclassified Bradyrhizobium]|uniref:hypothetical protein n=1 Tax=unclassified Bradyrhizobium TaxID=2631580 RepID=UPI0029170823|nr:MULTISPECIES: hypothetical protein [unclassified Bradyrhizobium]
MQETIERAAIFCDHVTWTVARPGRHHDVIAYIAPERPWLVSIRGQQGFVTSTGRFVGREEARKIAEAANQLIPTYGEDGVPFIRQHPQLFSEDVW